MKRPDKQLEELNGTLQRSVVEYVSFLEGWIEATKASIETIKAVAHRGPRKPGGPPKTEFSGMCGSCIHSNRHPAPEGSDFKTIALCTAPTISGVYGMEAVLIQEARQHGPCGPEAKLHEVKRGPERRVVDPPAPISPGWVTGWIIRSGEDRREEVPSGG